MRGDPLVSQGPSLFNQMFPYNHNQPRQMDWQNWLDQRKQKELDEETARQKRLAEKLEQKPDPINPNHYKQHPTGIECIEIIEHFAHNKAAAMGYIWRAGLKGDAIEDLQKAVWHLNREIERLKKFESKK